MQCAPAPHAHRRSSRHLGKPTLSTMRLAIVAELGAQPRDGATQLGESSPANLWSIRIARRGAVNGFTVLPPSFTLNGGAVGTVQYSPAVHASFHVPISLVPIHLLPLLPRVFLRASVHPRPVSRDGAVRAVQNPDTSPATFLPLPEVDPMSWTGIAVP